MKNKKKKLQDFYSSQILYENLILLILKLINHFYITFDRLCLRFSKNLR